MRRALLAGILLGVLFPRSGATASDAAPVDPEARRLYEEGLRSYRNGAYAEAIEQLNASYRRVPAPALLYNLAQAHRLMGDCPGALALYRRYLDSPGNDGVHALAAARANEMEACAAAPRAPAADPRPATAPPAAAVVQPVRAPPVDAPVLVAAPAEARPAARNRRAAWALTGTTLLLGATTGYFAWRAAASSDEVSRMYVPGATWGAAGASAEQTGQSSDTLALITGGATLVAAGIAAWLWR